ncbi:response regulator transcription factor [Leptolyngbya sp. NIES-2104]|uniref:response regulator transcription factor n=1 Tax=Leptolyngbya sp. NIES-2104 TaxID=1552121 RepID=UPI0006EC524B|nr:response regulator transcription factor [Leptolyngbya sp. NIES-2104]GAP95553.1 LuxR family transcriptional regulatory protein [Leptolyngbya sp. NIES-2104]
MIRVFIIAQSIVTQAGLTALLTPDLAIAGSAIRPASISSAIDASDATVILLEQDAMSDVSEVEIPIVLLLDDSSAIAEFLQAGIRSILPSDVSREQLTEAIKATSAGLSVLHPELIDSMFVPTVRSSEPMPLTPREVEVLTMLAEGLGNKAIAQHLNLSEHTVKFHISSIFSKLDVSSRTEAVILGAKQGWILL